jgi:hypothetical protein
MALLSMALLSLALVSMALLAALPLCGYISAMSERGAAWLAH